MHPHQPTDLHAHEHLVVLDIETIVDAPPDDGSFPPIPGHRPVAAAFLTVDWRRSIDFQLDTVICRPGEEAEFFRTVDALLPAGVTSIGYNTRGFDFRVLEIQAMAARVFDLPGMKHHARSSRFGRDHCDLAEQASFYGATRTTSLAELCRALQIPVKTSVSGGDVQALWLAGRHEEVAAYVREDVAATYMLWLHHCAARACDERFIAVPLDAFAKWIERQPDLEALLAFAHCEPALWARSRAPFHHVMKALSEAELRVRKAEDARQFGRDHTIF
jgi:hypothetical protein